MSRKHSKRLLVDNMKDTGFHVNIHDFSVDCDATVVDNVLDFHK